ncbi:cytochrome C oxidase subunit IV family protein [Nocardioides ultimimeridianus]
MLSRLLSDRQTAVWLVLVLATALTAALGLEERGSAKAVAVVLIAIGVVKLRLVAMHFMEVRRAPLALRLLIELYAAAVFASLAGIYLLG